MQADRSTSRRRSGGGRSPKQDVARDGDETGKHVIHDSSSCFLVEASAVEAQQHSLLLGIARPAAGSAARRLRGQDLHPPLALAPSHVLLEFVVVDQHRRASRSMLSRAAASSGILLVRSRT